MQLVLLLATVALLQPTQYTCEASSIHRDFRMPLKIDEENTLDSKVLPAKRVNMKRFVHITQKPPATLRHVAGDVLELNCEAMGSPAPSIQWLRNNIPITDYSQDSNELVDSSYTSLARMTATLIIAKPSSNNEDAYTCLVTAERSRDMASTTVYNVESNAIISERYKLIPLEPQIVAMYIVYMDTIGKDATLPCRAKGHPRPLVTWYDNNGVKIENHSRMKVLRGGELLIRDLRWTDMGEFTCQATNAFGETSKTTFIYPVKAG